MGLPLCTPGECAFGRIQVAPSGPIDADILLIGEAPGPEELKQGIPFVGRAGRLLDRLLQDAGLRRAELRITNTCGCVDLDREDRRPLPAELAACRPRLDAEIESCDPRVILLCGNTALATFFPGFRIGEVYNYWRAVPGYVTPFHKYIGRTVIPTYHPAHVLRGAKQVQPLIVDALRAARRIAEETP